MNKLNTFAFSILLLTATASFAHDGHHGPDVKFDMSKDMTNIPGKETIVLTVTYKPGEIETPHKHDAHCFVYVLEGTIVMGVKGKEEQTLKAGDTFYEGPEDIHTVGRNASKTEPAKFVVVMVKNKGAPPVLPLD